MQPAELEEAARQHKHARAAAEAKFPPLPCTCLPSETHAFCILKREEDTQGADLQPVAECLKLETMPNEIGDEAGGS